ncbi:unnamed protein product [Orchesella dallaii]|uniref:Gustatory receptor n=1 Tax=Orchesella dallaii TaxID=48710 RepID=A0ABP1R555_9HEXA
MSCENMKSVETVDEGISVVKKEIATVVCASATYSSSDESDGEYVAREVSQVTMEQVAADCTFKNCEKKATPPPSSSTSGQGTCASVIVVVENHPRGDKQSVESQRPEPTQTYVSRQAHARDTVAGKKVVGDRSLGDSSEITTIREFTSEQSTSVSGVLRFCKRRILFPYLKLLGIMGLKPLHSDANDVHIITLVFSKLYLFLVVIALLAGYFLQFTACFRRDIGFSYKEDISNPPFLTTLSEHGERSSLPSQSINGILNFTNAKHKPKHGDMFIQKQKQTWILDDTICEGNIIYIYIVPSAFHFLAFLYMVFLNWVKDDEHFQNLMERVFIQAAQANINEFSQRRLIARMQVMVFIGCFWILTTTSVHITQAVLTKVYINWMEADKIVTISISALVVAMTMHQNAIQITVMATFAVHCHLICTYAELLRVRLVHHSISLSDCMKELGELGQLLHYLNNDLATGLAPLLLINVIYAAGTVGHLITKGSSLPTPEFVSLIVIAGLWIVIVVFPLTQASKLSTCCFKLKDMGHMVRMRPFGYQFASQLDLDSFLLFVSNLNLQVKILKVPVTAAILSAACLLLVIIFLLWGYFH